MAVRKETVRNISKTKPITAKQAVARANQQIWQREFNPDYDQVVLRISSAPLCGLRFGQPPPCVS